MTTGAGLFLNPGETNLSKIVHAVRQIIEGRSNAVGSVTLTHDGSATSTLVKAPSCGPTSMVVLTPTTAHAGAVATTTIVKPADVGQAQFYITHAATASSDLTYFYGCFG